MDYYAVGYHGTTKEGENQILSNGIDVSRRANDVFLGRGFYIWRDSYQRAKVWNRGSDGVLELNVKCSHDEMLNFTSINWNNELDIIKLYLKYFKPKEIYFGEFIDFLIDDLGVDIKLITIMDLRNKATKIHIQDPYIHRNKTIFSYGDIQLCIKHQDIISELRAVDDES